MDKKISIVGMILWSLFILDPATPVHAGKIRDEPFPFRVSLALDRVTSFTDVAARQASVAHPIGSSVNPGSDDFLRDPPFACDWVGSVTSNFIAFESGAWLSGVSVTGARRLPNRGTISATYNRTDTQNGQTRQDFDDALRSNEFALGYSHKICDWLSVGLDGKVSQSTLDFGESPAPFVVSETETDSQGVVITPGVFMALSKEVFLGNAIGLGRSRSKTTGSVTTPFGTQPVDVTDVTTSLNEQFGVAWRPNDQVGVYGDLQYLHLESDLGHVDDARLRLGVELFPVPKVALRVGGSVDLDEQFTFSAGLGYYGIKHWPLEIAYVYNSFPEVRTEVGTAHFVSLSAVFVY